VTWLWVALILGLALVLGISLYGADQAVTIPYLPEPYNPTDFGWPYEEVAWMSPDGLWLKGWFIPAPKPSSITVIVLHGVGSNAGDMLLNSACLRSTGLWNLFFVNFRGHDGSQGHLTSLGPLELGDLLSALQYLQETKPQQAQRLAIYGHSLGASVALVGAARFERLEAVVAESPFASAAHTIRHFAQLFYGLPYFPFVPLVLQFASWRVGVSVGRFSPIKEIARIAPRPLLLIAGDRDKRIPLKDIRALWAAAKKPKELWVVAGADHGDPWLIAKEEFERRLVAFFQKAFSQ
jgi:pimeloyl-ACP methyl ester carboxylesterase